MRMSRHVSLNKVGIAVFTGALAISLLLASPMANAQTKKKISRDDAIQNCIHEAQQRYPDLEQKRNRVPVYKACMTKAGFRP